MTYHVGRAGTLVTEMICLPALVSFFKMKSLSHYTCAHSRLNADGKRVSRKGQKEKKKRKKKKRKEKRSANEVSDAGRCNECKSRKSTTGEISEYKEI